MAGGKNDKNIIIGAANVFVGGADKVEYRPAFTAGIRASATLTASTLWRDVGYTMEGIELSVEPDYGEVEVDQLLDTPRLYKQGMRATVNTTFAEATLENLLVVWGQRQTGDLATTPEIDIEAGELGDFPIERSICFVGPAPITTAGVRQERVYWAARGVQTESTSFAARRSEATGLPASFRLLPLGIQSGNTDKVRYGRILDRAAA